MTGQQLRAIREQLGLTQEQLAESLGIPPNTLARWERSEVTIRHPVILSLALTAIAAKRD